ncbi:MAG: hypothetical protein ACFFDX_11385 [Candidatus Odinarchaeota archaeon]
MERDESFFKELIKNEDFKLINDILIEVSKRPNKNDLNKINFLITDASISVLEKIKLNLIYFLGEFGKVEKLDVKYLQFLVNSYFNSDRWIRNEIIETFNKLSKANELTDEIITILAYAILEDYTPIKNNALDAIKKLDFLPDLILKNLLKILEHSSRELVENIIKVLKFHFENSQALFSMLNSSKNFTFLEKNSIRSLLVAYFDSIINLEAFRKKIINSEWPEKHKTLFYNEIDTYQKILARSI